MAAQRDSQRSKVYAWEQQWLPANEEALTLPQCVDLACYLYGKRVVVKDGRGRRRGGASTTRAMITMPKFTRNPCYVAHEVAHLLTNRIDKDLPPHGRTFMREYLQLLEVVGAGDIETNRKSAEGFGLKVAK